MSLVTILPSRRSYDAAPGTTLLAAILAAGEKLVSKCGGEASCGACHVYLVEGRKGVNRITPAENAKLDTIVGVGSKSRLACQVTIGAEPVTVELLGAMS